MLTVCEKSIRIANEVADVGVAKVKLLESESDDQVCVRFTFAPLGEIVASTDADFFSALQEIRKQLEQKKLKLLCFAADLRVYPSPMQRSMGVGTLAYRNVLGKQATSGDIVEILDIDDSFEFSTVSEQEEFHQSWFKSL